MMEGFAKTIGIVAKIRIESIGQCVAFGFKQETNTVILGEGLIDHRSCTVGRDKQGKNWRLLRLNGKCVLFA